MVAKRISTMSITEIKEERKAINVKLDEPKRKVFSKSTQALLARDKKLLIRLTKLRNDRR